MKNSPSKNSQIKAARNFEEQLKCIRHEAEMLEKNVLEFITNNTLDIDVHSSLLGLVGGAEDTQVTINDYIRDACIWLLKIEDEESEEDECQQSLEYRQQVRQDYCSAIRI